MKHFQNLKFLLVGGVATVLWSCNSYIDEIAPESSITPEATFSDSASAVGALVGAYSNLTEEVYSRAIIIGAFQDVNLDFAGSFTTYQLIEAGDITDDNTSLTLFYSEPYQMINRANRVLEGIAETPISADTRDLWSAECRFLRAYGHFFLLMHFGDRALQGPSADGNLGVPIITSSFTEGFEGDPQLRPARNTNDEVWDFIISELNAIRAELPVGLSGDGGRLATQGAADGLLARAYLYRQDYSNAADAANTVISSGVYALTGSLENTDVNTGPNPELVFYADLGTLNNPGVNDAVGSFFRPQSQGGRGDQRIITDGSGVYSLYSGTDSRLGLYDVVDGITWTTKFFDSVTNADDLPIVRYADVVLMRAEALQRANAASVNSEAVDLLNEVVTARDSDAGAFATDDFADADALIDRILEERNKELAHEGIWKFDLIRTGQGVKNIPAEDHQLQFPIPRSERDQNPNLIQNPNY